MSVKKRKIGRTEAETTRRLVLDAVKPERPELKQAFPHSHHRASLRGRGRQIAHDE